MTDSRTRHSRGLLVVILLGVVFFTLLALIVLKAGKDPVREAGAAPNESLTVLPVRIRIRTEPRATAAVVASATSGEKLQLLEDRGAWVRVQNADGLAGWAERQNLERTSERQRRLARYAAIRNLPPLQGRATDRTPLYAGPGIFYPLVGELDDGADVVVFTRDHEFYAIDHDGAVAYAGIDDIDVSASGTRQLDVQTSSAGTAPTETATAPPTETVAEAPVPEPVAPVPAPEPVESTTGVYSAVPPGGTQPMELSRAMPRYPAVARSRGAEGRVILRGIVRRDGTIDDVQIVQDQPYGLGDAAREAVRRWRFRPASYRGEPIDVYYTVTVNFRLQ